MTDRDFDKLFSNQLSDGLSLPPNERMWEDMADRLDEHDRQTKGGGIVGGNGSAWWRRLAWLLPLLFLLLGANFWFLLKMNQTRHQNEQLMGEMKGMKTLMEKKDTILQTKTIQKTDTIFIYKYLRSTSNRDKKEPTTPEVTPSVLSAFESQKPSLSGLLSNFKDLNVIRDLNVNVSPNSQSTANQGITQPVNLVSDEIKPPVFEKETLFIDTIKPAKNAAIVSEKNTFTKRDTIRDTIYIVKYLPMDSMKNVALAVAEKKDTAALRKKKTFYIGANAGTIYYNGKWFNANKIELQRQENSYQVGLRAEYALSDQWRLMGGVDYSSFNFKLYWTDDRYNLPLMPREFRDTTVYKMTSVAAKQPVLQSMLGVKYLFKSSAWKPYVGLAYSIMTILPYHADYQVGEVANSSIQHDAQSAHPGVTIYNIIMATGGVEYRLGKNWTAQAEGFYYKDVNSTPKTYDEFGARAVILFNF